jgi:hypothetical protein
MYWGKHGGTEHSKGNKTVAYQKKWLQHVQRWTLTEYRNKHCDIDQKDEGTWDDQGRDGGTNCILRIKELETRLTLHEHDDDDDDDIYIYMCVCVCVCVCVAILIILIKTEFPSYAYKIVPILLISSLLSFLI